MNHPLALVDVDPLETREWLEALEVVTTVEGRSRAHYLIDRLTDFDASRHGDMHGRVTSAYVNTIGKADCWSIRAARCGLSWVTARWTSRNRWPLSRSQGANASTT